MARSERGCLTLWLQGDGTAEQENRANILPPEELEDVDHYKVVADYKPEA